MLPIRQSAEKIVKKFVGFNLCFILMFITLCNIFPLTCFADEEDAISSATEISVEDTEKSTESITEFITEEVTEATETLGIEEVSEIFYFRFIIVLLIVILFLIIVSKLF